MSALFTFTLAGQLFGLPLAAVREVILLPPLTAVPQAPAAVSGLANWRGQAVPVINVAQRLALPTTLNTALHLVIVATATGPVGLQIATPGETLATTGALQAPPKSYAPYLAGSSIQAGQKLLHLNLTAISALT